MQNYVTRWEQISTQLTSLYASINEFLMIAMFVKRFRDRSELTIGTALSALLTSDALTWPLVTSPLSQKFASQKGSRLMGETSQDKRFVIQSRITKKNKSLQNPGINGVEFRFCDKNDHVRVEYFNGKGDKSKDDANKMYKQEKAFIGVTKKNKHPTRMALTATHEAFMNSGTTAHMHSDVLVISVKAVSSDISIGKAGRNMIKATAQVEFVI